jgi:tetratricopeptide (TPR) repeat protein
MPIGNLTLLMIVRNESGQIERALKSCLPYIDHWIIVDTGSTDNTMEIIKSTLEGIPGTLHSRPWVNFGFNRTELLRLYEATLGLQDPNGFALAMDADQALMVEDENFKASIPEGKQFLIRVQSGGSYEYRMPYLIRMIKEYSYVGATHEYLTPCRASERINYDAISIMHHGDGGSKSDKLPRDRRLLEQELTTDPRNPRTHFYLAQTLNDMGHKKEAIKHYNLASEATSWHEERFMSRLRNSKIYMELGEDSNAVLELLRAIDAAPHRFEPYFYLGKLLNALKLHRSAFGYLKRGSENTPHNDILFVEKWIEDYGLELELGVAHWWCNEKSKAKSIFESLLANENIPEHAKATVIGNLKLCE